MKTAGTLYNPIIKINHQSNSAINDAIAVEEPLQIQLQLHSATGRVTKNIAITMRTPGNDKELAAGFLYTEGIINNENEIDFIKHIQNDNNKILAVLKEGILPNLQNQERFSFTSASCGICGKTNLDALQTNIPFQHNTSLLIAPHLLYTLPEKLTQQQQLFEHTGGLHAAALFTQYGDFVAATEDIGRHNALDKLIGAGLLANTLPWTNNILLLSGRISFELVQKAAKAGIKMIVAFGAPSSMAVEMAIEQHITLIGFLKKDSMNIYCGVQRLIL